MRSVRWPSKIPSYQLHLQIGRVAHCCWLWKYLGNLKKFVFFPQFFICKNPVIWYTVPNSQNIYKSCQCSQCSSAVPPRELRSIENSHFVWYKEFYWGDVTLGQCEQSALITILLTVASHLTWTTPGHHRGLYSSTHVFMSSQGSVLMYLCTHVLTRVCICTSPVLYLFRFLWSEMWCAALIGVARAGLCRTGWEYLEHYEWLVTRRVLMVAANMLILWTPAV